jgi:hypothetical protein
MPRASRRHTRAHALQKPAVTDAYSRDSLIVGGSAIQVRSVFTE